MSITQNINYQILDNKTETVSQTISLRTSHKNETQMYLIHRALKQQLKNNRKRNAHTKTRSEVRGGGRKPWKQKGTGRARAGSSRSPLWRGGGVIFGPRNKIYTSKINKKEKRLAINTIIANKFDRTIVIKDLLNQINVPKTKTALSEIKKLGINIQKNQKLLIIVNKKTQLLQLSFRNVNNIELIEIHSVNILSLLKADIIIVTHDALNKISV
uniref:Large ribosomal subunit protein uL4c n=1 Tax=Dipterosiphonia australica TaxID=2007208 RepID=A0A1Z1MLZ0_9FLOR|nr:ribosomal protein L4 [Dipterosiphonia australica]ARW66869.1 ribosomal protein L4 [Dipterosiphonia australica]